MPKLKILLVGAVILLIGIFVACGSNTKKDEALDSANQKTNAANEEKRIEVTIIREYANNKIFGKLEVDFTVDYDKKDKRYLIHYYADDVKRWEVDAITGDVTDADQKTIGNVLQGTYTGDVIKINNEEEIKNTEELEEKPAIKAESKVESKEGQNTNKEKKSLPDKGENPIPVTVKKPTGDVTNIVSIDANFNNFVANIKYRDKIQNNLIKVLRDDLDGDGIYELVVSFGIPGQGINNQLIDSYLIKETKNGYKEIEANISVNNGYFYDMKIVEGESAKYKYIEGLGSDGRNPTSDTVYQYKDGKFEKVEKQIQNIEAKNE